MRYAMKTYIVLFCCLFFLGGCSSPNYKDFCSENFSIKTDGSPSITSNSLLACLNDTESIESKEFNTRFKFAEENLVSGLEIDTFNFICLSLNTKADYIQFKHGTMVLEQYMEEHSDSEKDLQGFLILIDRLDNAIRNKWTSWKTLLNDKKALKADVATLKARVEELQKQIDQLKNIENIIESRE
jgi:hypothetical protein